MNQKIYIAKEIQEDSLIQLFLNKLQGILLERGYKFKIAEPVENYSECGIYLTINNEDMDAFHIYTEDKHLVIEGGGYRGLAYGIQSYTEWLLENKELKWYQITEIIEEPAVKIRGIDKFIMNSDDERWWMNKSYWNDFISFLAKCRINRLCLATGFDTEYFSPPYPFLFSLEDENGVSVNREIDRNGYLEALRMIGHLCHEYHLEFSFAIWQQQPWQRGPERMVFGLDSQNKLCEYCCKGIKKLLFECPEIDIIQFRVNHESGVGTEISAEDYWLRQIESVGEVNRSGRKIKLELRAKGMTDRMVKHAEKEGLSLTVSTKYCCEHAGLPYHLSRMRTQELSWLDNLNMARRYSYSDLLKKPREYGLLYRLWGNGSSDLFTWGDADYVRKFVESMKLGEADGYEVIPPLTLKGGREFDKHTQWKLFSDEKFQPPGWEGERYWLFYILYGRIGYNPNCREFIWKKEMEDRLGENAEIALEIITLSSKVIPFITSYHFPEHPQLWYWTEMSTGAALFPENNFHPDFKREGDTYQDTLPCDEGLFYSVSDYVKAAGKTDGRYTPYQIYGWLSQICINLKSLLRTTDNNNGNWEWKGILLDAEMLLELTEFHRHKLLAAIGLSYFLSKADGTYLKASVRKMEEAHQHWKKLSQLGKAYHDNLLFGAGIDCHRRGNWSDYLPEIEKDILKLKKLADSHGTSEEELLHNISGKRLLLSDNIPERHKAGKKLEIKVLNAGDDIDMLYIRYRHTNQLEGCFHKDKMEKAGEKFIYTITGEYLSPEWDLLLYFEAVDENGDGMVFPGIDNMTQKMPYKLITISS